MRSFLLAVLVATALFSTGSAQAQTRFDIVPDLVLSGDLAFDVAGTHATGAVEEEMPATIFGLPRNVGTLDRVIRIVAGLALAGVGAFGLYDQDFDDGWAAVMIGVSSLPLLTGAIGYCPLYHVFGWDTNF